MARSLAFTGLACKQAGAVGALLIAYVMDHQARTQRGTAMEFTVQQQQQRQQFTAARMGLRLPMVTTQVGDIHLVTLSSLSAQIRSAAIASCEPATQVSVVFV